MRSSVAATRSSRHHPTAEAVAAATVPCPAPPNYSHADRDELAEFAHRPFDSWRRPLRDNRHPATRSQQPTARSTHPPPPPIAPIRGTTILKSKSWRIPRTVPSSNGQSKNPAPVATRPTVHRTCHHLDHGRYSPPSA